MTERDASTGTATTLEAGPPAPFAQEPMTESAAADGKSAERRAARDLKRAGRAERRADRKGQADNGADDTELEGVAVAVPVQVSDFPPPGPGIGAPVDPVIVVLPPSSDPAEEGFAALAADASSDGLADGTVADDSRDAKRAGKQAARAERREAKNGAADVVDAATVDAAAVPAASLVRPQMLTVIGEDKEKQSAKAISRIESQHRQAQEAIAGVDMQGSAIAPLIRYVNAVSHQLNESQKAIGKLQVERDALRAQVIGMNGVPVDVDAIAEQAGGTDHLADSAKSQRRDARKTEPEKEPKSVEDMGRQRRLIALTGLAVLGIVALVLRLTAHSVDLSNVSKNGLGSVAIIGSFMQVFLAGMIFYRLIRVGGRGAKWLFPENDPKAQKKLAQKKETPIRKRA